MDEQPGGAGGDWGAAAAGRPPAPPGIEHHEAPDDPGEPTAAAHESMEILGAPAPPDRRRWLIVAAVVVVLAAVVGGGFLVFGGDDGPPHPKAWDPRIADLAHFVEHERDLTFDHPVAVEFLPDAEFRKRVTAHDDLTAKDRAQLETTEASLRAVGLISGDVDLVKMSDELVGDGVVGLYDFDDKHILVRGDQLDDERRATLVHELTHALQDQKFHISRHDTKTSGASDAYEAVVEADAEKVKQAWHDSLPADARQRLDQAEAATSDQADFAGVPQVFVELMGFPYAFGPDFVDAIVDDKGPIARDEMFTDPPTTEENIVLPETYLAGQRAEKVATPALHAGEKSVAGSEGDFGMLSLLVVLSERVDFAKTWPAVQGWAGDAARTFTRNGTTCVRADVRFDTDAEAQGFAGVFDEWANGLPAKETRSARNVELESCDPGKDAVVSTDPGHISGIRGLVLRRSLIQGMTQSGLPAKSATCVADGVVARLGGQRLNQLDQTLQQAADPAAIREVAQATQAAAAACPIPGR